MNMWFSKRTVWTDSLNGTNEIILTFKECQIWHFWKGSKIEFSVLMWMNPMTKSIIFDIFNWQFQWFRYLRFSFLKTCYKRVWISSSSQNRSPNEKVPFEFQPKSQFFAAALTYCFSWLKFKQNPSLGWRAATFTIPDEVLDGLEKDMSWNCRFYDFWLAICHFGDGNTHTAY